MLGEDRIGIEQARTIECAFRDDALPFAKQIGQHALIGDAISRLPSVTSKRTFRLSPRTKLPAFTNPPSRMRVPDAICFSATSLGELKNTIESRNALSMSATAIASTPSAAADQNQASPFAGHDSRFHRHDPSSALEPEAFDQIVDTLGVVGTVAERALGVGGGVLSLVALTEHDIGAHQAQPAVDIGAIAVQPIGKARDHAADHVAALVVAQIGSRGDIVGAWTGSQRPVLPVARASA